METTSTEMSSYFFQYNKQLFKRTSAAVKEKVNIFIFKTEA